MAFAMLGHLLGVSGCRCRGAVCRLLCAESLKEDDVKPMSDIYGAEHLLRLFGACRPDQGRGGGGLGSGASLLFFRLQQRLIPMSRVHPPPAPVPRCMFQFPPLPAAAASTTTTTTPVVSCVVLYSQAAWPTDGVLLGVVGLPHAAVPTAGVSEVPAKEPDPPVRELLHRGGPELP